MADRIFELVDVSASYGPLAAPTGVGGTEGPGREAPLRDVSLTIDAGELVCVLGPNGAGKSTLLRVLAGTLAPSAGSARLLGKSIGTWDRRRLARHVAVVPQTSEAAFGFIVRDVVMMGRAPHQDGWMRATSEDRAIVEDAIVRCDLGDLALYPVQELSGGEQKRVAIARALAQRPRALLLDEPGAFLDVRHQMALYDLLADATTNEGLACLVVMHDLNVAAQYASRVVLAKSGQFVATGTVADVMTEAALRETFDTNLFCGENDKTRFFLPIRGASKVPG